MSCDCKCSMVLINVPWASVQCVIFAFPDHTHFLLDYKNPQPEISHVDYVCNAFTLNLNSVRN